MARRTTKLSLVDAVDSRVSRTTVGGWPRLSCGLSSLAAVAAGIWSPKFGTRELWLTNMPVHQEPSANGLTLCADMSVPGGDGLRADPDLQPNLTRNHGAETLPRRGWLTGPAAAPLFSSVLDIQTNDDTSPGERE